jgi:hypothetical protein
VKHSQNFKNESSHEKSGLKIELLKSIPSKINLGKTQIFPENLSGKLEPKMDVIKVLD